MLLCPVSEFVSASTLGSSYSHGVYSTLILFYV